MKFRLRGARQAERTDRSSKEKENKDESRKTGVPGLQQQAESTMSAFQLRKAMPRDVFALQDPLAPKLLCLKLLSAQLPL
mmetsp:Transcript_30326/g.78829  ORF Transcript_30326/g.78829 Transcript_30326/m.78829 type:complete len:80 (-) Transcript_30326:5762-6001(-)|eukprot:1156191-Pelagomonas_calceolata.AAC.2